MSNASASDRTETVDLKYTAESAQLLGGELIFLQNGKEWFPAPVKNGETVQYVINQAGNSFQFQAITFWYERVGQSAPHRAARTFDNVSNQDPVPVRGVSVSSIQIPPNGPLQFLLANDLDLDDDATLGLEVTICDKTNGSTKNNMYSSRDPQVPLERPPG